MVMKVHASPEFQVFLRTYTIIYTNREIGNAVVYTFSQVAASHKGLFFEEYILYKKDRPDSYAL